MGPKPKGGKGKAAPVIIDGVNTSEMTREQLEQFALRLKEELEREREERNFFQLERDKLRTFWEITRNDLEEANARLRNKDREIEVAAEKNDEEIKVYRQKVKHLQYEHQNNLAELKAEAMISLQNAQDNHTEQENELLRDKKDLKKKLRDQELAHQDEVKVIKLQHSEEIDKERQRFYEMAKETEMKFEKQYEIFRNEVHTKHSMEMKEVEERKNQQIKDLIEDHDKAFKEIKNYYNDITLNNLALINSLKEQMEELNRQNERMCKQVGDVSAENRKLVEPLKAAQAEAKELRRQLQNYNKDKQALANTLTKLKTCEQELQDLKWSNNALEIRFEKVAAEREFLKDNFVKGMLEVQQKTGLKNMLLQKKVQALVEILENKDVMLGELVAATNMKPQVINRKLEDLLKKRNTVIKDLQYELARVCKAHDDLLLTYETKLLQYGIPQSELGFTPLRVTQEGQLGLSRGPAGLVTRNR